MDRIVRLYNLPSVDERLLRLAKQKINIRRARTYEKHLVLDWIKKSFSRGWADECEVCFHHPHVTCFIATHNSNIIGFCCYEATYKNFVGPMGVQDGFKGKQIGTALFYSCLYGMEELGYAYAIIPDVDANIKFFSKIVHLDEIKDSEQGIYTDRLQGGDS